MSDKSGRDAPPPSPRPPTPPGPSSLGPRPTSPTAGHQLQTVSRKSSKPGKKERPDDSASTSRRKSQSGREKDDVRELRDLVMSMKHTMKAEISQELREEMLFMEKERASITADFQPPMPMTKAPPVGMTPEQLGEFKKQNMYVSALQNRVKELEKTLAETNDTIRHGHERLEALTEQEAHNAKSLYTNIDQINNTLSEKIAQQRVQVQKLADDQPKPINYDPFNYGDAYAGDLVDFQARKRIIELKCMLTVLKARIDELGGKAFESPKINLGYTVMRLDDILQMTGFDQLVKSGGVGPGEVLLLSQQNTQRTPGRQDFPRQEIFQNPEQSSKWAITDSIMQTMYRLETEVAELQRMVSSSGVDAHTNTLSEMQTTLRVLKDTKLDQSQAKKMIEDMATNRQSVHPSALSMRRPSRRSTVIEDTQYVTVENFVTVIRGINKTIDSLATRLQQCPPGRPVSPTAAATRTSRFPSPLSDRNCLTCDMQVRRPSPRHHRQTDTCLPRLPEFGSRPSQLAPRDRLSPRIRHFLSSGYDIRVNNEVVNVFHVHDHRPPDSMLGVTRPGHDTLRADTPGQPKPYNLGEIPDVTPKNRCNFFLKGKDNKMYQADPYHNQQAWALEMQQRQEKHQTIEREKRLQLSGLRRGQSEKVFTSIEYKGQAFKSTRKRSDTSPKLYTPYKRPPAVPGMVAYSTSPRVKPITTRLDYDAALCLRDTLVVVHFTAQWCVACVTSLPAVHLMAETFQQVRFHLCDVDHAPAVVEMCRVTSLPTYMIYLNRELVETLVGASTERLQQSLVAHLKAMVTPVSPSGGIEKRRKSFIRELTADEAAVKIQRGMQGLVQKKKEKKVQIEIAKQQVAATKIQASVRGHQTRRSLQNRQEFQTKTTKIKFHSSPDTLVASPSNTEFKGRRVFVQSPRMPTGGSNPGSPAPPTAPPTVNPPTVTPPTAPPKEEEVDIDLADPEVEKAALLIQKKSMFGKKKKKDGGSATDSASGSPCPSVSESNADPKAP